MSDSTTAPVIAAATLLLCREGDTGLEVLMVKRHHKIDFASGALVFPGGKLCADDQDEHWQSTRDANGTPDDGMLPFYVAACRESFEESGILYAYGNDGKLVDGARSESLSGHRDAIASGQASFREFVQREELRPAFDRFAPFARWITPGFMPKRFDTWFFIAETPAYQVAVHDGSESVDSVWISPKAALSGAEDGTYTIIFPTRCNLMMLAESDTVAHALDRARERSIVTIEPWLEERDEKRMICIPTESGYPVCAEVADFPS